MNQDLASWQSDLATQISAALAEFRNAAEDEMAIFAVDCHPWNGIIVLAFLTQAEFENDPVLSEPAEMAAWRYYDFGAGLAAWQPTSRLAAAMRSAYETAGDDRPPVSKQFLEACKAAVASRQVQNALSAFRLREGFKAVVPHPDRDA